jgi:hypothetical protein
MKRILSITVLGLLLAAAPALAAIPRLINFQGRLADGNGTPKTGSYAITFRLFTVTTGGTACHSEGITVPVNSGLFNINIGSTQGGINSACDFSVPYYLELQVSPDSPMSPRIALTAAPYAIRAALADDSVKLQGLVPGAGSGNIPINSGVRMVGLNADTLDGYDSSQFVMRNGVGVPVYKNVFDNSLTLDSGWYRDYSPQCPDDPFGNPQYHICTENFYSFCSYSNLPCSVTYPFLGNLWP